jgi:hypothetical protein
LSLHGTTRRSYPGGRLDFSVLHVASRFVTPTVENCGRAIHLGEPASLSADSWLQVNTFRLCKSCAGCNPAGAKDALSRDSIAPLDT